MSWTRSFNGSSSAIYVDGTSVASGAIGATNFSGNLNLGSSPGNADYFDGAVGEIILYPSALSTTDRQSVENYLINKWIGSPTASGRAAVLPRVPTTATVTVSTPITVTATAPTLPRVPTTASVTLDIPVQAETAIVPRVPTTATVQLVISAAVTPYTETGYAFLERSRSFRAVPSVTVPLAGL